MHKTTVDVPQLDTAAEIATLTLPPGTYYVVAIGSVQDDFHGGTDVEIVCTLRGVKTEVQADEGVGTLAVSNIFTVTDASPYVTLECLSRVGSDHIEDLDLTAVKLGSVVEQ